MFCRVRQMAAPGAKSVVLDCILCEDDTRVVDGYRVVTFVSVKLSHPPMPQCRTKTSHPGQLSFLTSTGWKISTDQSTVR